MYRVVVYVVVLDRLQLDKYERDAETETVTPVPTQRQVSGRAKAPSLQIPGKQGAQHHCMENDVQRSTTGGDQHGAIHGQ